jgi:hypothetical protein
LAAAYRIGVAQQKESKELVIRQNVSSVRILGIPIGLDYSWYLMFAPVTWLLGGSYYPAEIYRELMLEFGVPSGYPH